MSDEFQGESGLKEDWDGTIAIARFEQQGRGNWALQMTSLADDGEEVRHRALSVGGADKGWASHDGGEEIMGTTVGQKFHMQSAIQGFINRVMALDGAADELRKRSKDLYESRGPMHAKLWEGLRFHWDVIQEPRREPNPDNPSGSWVVKAGEFVGVMVPERYLGVADEAPKAHYVPQPSQQQTLPSSAPSSTNGGDISEADMVTLKLIAMSAETHKEFADAVMDTQGENGELLTRNPSVRKSLAKKEWWEALKS